MHAASFSTGLSSAFMVERLRQRYGDDALTIVLMDVLNEHSDNYRFKHKLIASRWPRINFVDLAEGRNPWQVAEDENMIFNQRRHPCTRILKIEPFMNWLSTLTEKPTIHIGIDWHETHRCAAIKNNYEKAGYGVDFPLLWKPLEYRPYEQIARDDWGIEPPAMYSMGFSHANCGERGCFAWGIGDWLRFYTHNPSGFAEAEAWEKRMRQRPGLGNYAICRDQSGGTVKPRTLESIRVEYEASNKSQISLGLFDQRSGCTHCGVGDFVVEQGGR